MNRTEARRHGEVDLKQMVMRSNVSKLITQKLVCKKLGLGTPAIPGTPTVTPLFLRDSNF